MADLKKHKEGFGVYVDLISLLRLATIWKGMQKVMDKI